MVAKEYAIGKSIKMIQLHNPKEYEEENEKTLRITAEFDEISQDLEGISAKLIDAHADENFREKELKSLADFAGNPEYLEFSGLKPKNLAISRATCLRDLIPENSLSLNIAKFNLFMITQFELQREENEKYIELKSTINNQYEIVNYEEFGKIFRIDLKGKDSARNFQLPKEIEISKIVEAYEWTVRKGLLPSFSLFGNEKGKDKKTLHISRTIMPDDSLKNTFELEYSIDNSYGKNRAIIQEQVEVIEAKINGYRGTDLSQMPFNVEKFDVFGVKYELPSLKGERRKAGVMRCFCADLIQQIRGKSKIKRVYKELPIRDYGLLPEN
ncbi:MAG: hypothetical protein KAS15_04105 [Nanoarchaeota archaeon]|nr:hypothetical protein [Nanoarchaeota archaeon]